MLFYKTVLMPIRVLVGGYCWGDGRCCEYFDNEGGMRCIRGFSPLEEDAKGRVLKPGGCLFLEDCADENSFEDNPPITKIAEF